MTKEITILTKYNKYKHVTQTFNNQAHYDAWCNKVYVNGGKITYEKTIH